MTRSEEVESKLGLTMPIAESSSYSLPLEISA
jgi:hypothetical protein